MNISDAFPSKWLAASDLAQSGAVTATIESVQVESVGIEQEQRPVLRFRGGSKALILNRINSSTIAEIIGSTDTDRWIGQLITLVPARTEYQGKSVPCIRIRPADAAPAQAPAPAPAQAPAPAPAVGVDEIPF